ncbi:terminase small subunit [Geobacter sp. AOG1]|uniref:terminase small subunit n=1 Tax=Geobacter sp. AOG1 TaxID=1566346 RepID=UPI001CC4EF03|nr:terminase small subunit [Geobacter sp. AOG1]GFE56407.1 terminase small subunit [Geobacter sp. AOG1]
MTPKQELFVVEYLKDLNATQAAIRAGYSAKTARQIAEENLSKPYIMAAINEAKKERIEEVKLDANYVLTNLQKVVERCMQAVPVLKKEGGEWVETGEFRFDSSGANRALELIGKHNKMFTDVVEMNNFDNLTEEQLFERIAKLHEKLGFGVLLPKKS